MPYEPHNVANNLLQIAKRNGEDLSPMKLQKLVYFSHGWNLGLGHGPLSTEEAQAWQWGPVFPSLYQAVKTWGSGAILQPITRVVIQPRRPGQRRKREVITPYIDEDDEFTLALLQRVWEVYGGMTAMQLSTLSHKEDGPWALAQRERKNTISNESIAAYFRGRIVTNAE